MTRADALAVWQDLTRELWPDADVEKSALRIEHQEHVDWLLKEASACGCPQVYFSGEPSHLPDCLMMAAFEALDMPEGHAEVGRAFDLARPISTADLTLRQAAEGTLFGIEPSTYDLWPGNPPITLENIERALLRGPFPTSASMEARLAATQRLVEEGILTQEQADDLATGR